MIEEKYIRDSLIIEGILSLDKDTSTSSSEVTDSFVHQYKMNYNYVNNGGNNNHYGGHLININNNNQNQDQNEVSTPTGEVIYKVQVGSFANAGLKENLKKIFGITEEIKVDVFQGAYKYSVGTFYTYASARQYANSIKARTGIKAFVISFKDDIRIPVSDARTITGE